MFIDARLLECVSPGFSGGPQWNTRITPLANGNENRNAEWSMPHYLFVADYVLLDPRDQNEVLAAFNAAGGSEDCFRFKDWNDFKIVGASLGTGDGGSVPRQAVKDYTFGPKTRTRIIRLPVASTLAVTANGSPLAVTVDDETGLITPAATWPSGQAIVISYCEFDCKVRFGKDHYPFTQLHRKAATCTIDLKEVAR